VAFVSGSQFQTFLNDRSVAEKVDPILDSLDWSGMLGIRFIHPFSSTPKNMPFNLYLKSEGFIKLIDAFRILFGLEARRYELLFETLHLGKFDITYKFHAAANFEVMKRVGPLVVIGIGLTDIQVAIAHSLGIHCVELQHGAYYKGAPIARLSPNQNPDLFFVWDSESQFFLHSQGLKAVNIGHPHLKTSRHASRESYFNSYVLVTLSYDESPSHDPFNILHPDIHWALIELGKLGIPHKVRLHPFVETSPHLGPRDFPQTRHLRRYFKNTYPNALLSFPSENSLEQDLSHSFLQVTYASSSIIEASYYGVKTIYFGLPKNELINLEKFIKHGIVQFVDRETFYEHLTNEPFEFQSKGFIEEFDSEIAIKEFKSLLLQPRSIELI
jgi:hypothetical protein